MKKSFSFITSKEPKILILGTMPGEESLLRGEYYAHPRNAFWPVLFKCFGAEISAQYKDKKNLIINNNLALWDVLNECERQGSLDSEIKNFTPNKIDVFLRSRKSVRAIFFNGKGAGRFYKRFFAPFEEVKYFYLPSTSPAYAAKSLEEKTALWKQAFYKALI
ncbi:G:T/U mismatch-specific DNA glycosylase [Elusimicrobium minutum Pei191]|uniref:G:T/U mismatch-specific DNA glycosylase n=1 Tax=Elusimicrobium minutum (strain Pei191) TaxID=445932 RepID=B2KDM2_ELUMP|nr:DNA-deoxyinosine glycosylase [Elusimicrobium minutum]ACC98618.1 G:T/U mismatch-specific DNA glycosylase [Elusimicrobium minutum Pei191]